MTFTTTEAERAVQSMQLLAYFIVACLVTETSSVNSFQRATDSNGTDFCATQRPSVIYDIDELDLPYSGSICSEPPEALCALKCTIEPECVSLNWHAETRQCELFSYSPTQCEYHPNCVHFEVDKHLHIFLLYV